MNSKAIQEAILAAKSAKPLLENLDITMLDKKVGFEEYLSVFNDLNVSSSLNEDEKENKAITILDQLADRIILIKDGLPKGNELIKQHYAAYRLLFVAEILFNLRFKRASLLAANQSLKIARKFQFLNIAFQCARLVYSVSHFEGNIRKEKRAVALFQDYLKYYSIEKSIEIDRNAIFNYYGSTQSTSNVLSQRCQELIEKYSPHENKIPSFFFHTYLYQLKHIKYTNDKNHLAVHNNALNALDWLENLPFMFLPGRLVYIYVIIVFSIQKRQYLKAQHTIHTALDLVNIKSQHWYRLKENEFLLNLHRGSYNNACSIFYEAYRSSSLHNLLKLDQQRWQLYEIYVRILLEAGLAEYAGTKTQYNVQRFINDLPRFSNDKRAMNIPIIIAQMIFLIIRRKYDKATDRIGALEKYSTRYLKNDDTFRSNCFIKMLLEIPKQGFNQKAVERHAKKYTTRLKESELEFIDQPFEIEIIPYERLWELIMNNLSKKNHYQKAI